MATITIGPPVRDDDFFNRKTELAMLWEAVEKGSVLLAAPRRVGKTSIMLDMLYHPQPRYENRVFFLEAEYFSTPEEFVADLAEKSSKTLPHMKRVVNKLLDEASRVEELAAWEFRLKLRERLRGDWKDRGRELALEMAGENKPCLLLIDELSVLLGLMATSEEGACQAVELLHWLRALRQEIKGISMVLGSSLGIGRVASRLNASRTLNDLQQIQVGPFDAGTAREFAEALLASKGLEVDAGTMDTLLGQVETFIPLFIQMMVAALATEVHCQKTGPTPELVKWCYEERVHGPEFRHQFEDYYERLSRYYTATEAAAAKRLLRELAFSSDGISYATLFAIYAAELGPKADREGFDLLLEALQDDFYITMSGPDKRLRFHTKWLRDWWRRYHALGS